MPAILNSFYLALLVMITFIQVNKVFAKHAKYFNIRQRFEGRLNDTWRYSINKALITVNDRVKIAVK